MKIKKKDTQVCGYPNPFSDMKRNSRKLFRTAHMSKSQPS